MFTYKLIHYTFTHIYPLSELQMTPEIIIVLVITISAVILFATELIPVDLVAILIMSSLILSGIITAEEGVEGFSNTATVTVGAMFILSSGLFKTGAVNSLGARLSTLFKYNFYFATLVLMLSVGVVSAFINNTPVVAIMIPLMIGAAHDSGHSPSKLLMPLSFASMFGGVCTLIGTSTNILVSSIAVQYGQPAIGIFEMTPLGIIFLGTGIIYMLVIGIHLIPVRKEENELTQKFGMGDYLTEIIVLPDSPAIGKKLINADFVQELDIDVMEIQRNSNYFFTPHGDVIIQEGDILKVRCDVKRINQIKEKQGIDLKIDVKLKDKDVARADTLLVEAIIAPNSELEGRTLKQINFRRRFSSTVLAIRHRGRVMREKLTNTQLAAGDALLIEVRKNQLPELKKLESKQESPFLIISELGIPMLRRTKAILAFAIIIGVVLAASLNLVNIMFAAIIGCLLLILTNCITTIDAYEAIDWKVIFLLAGALSLGTALQKTGTAELIASGIIDLLGSYGPIVILSALYLITTILTDMMSNNASAVLLAPMAVVAANAMGVDARPFLFAIAFAASSSFMTPVGYQTNTMIYGAGQYKFMDFVKVGTPLNIIFWLLATFLIPQFFPF
jgi:di/tricarboxylate transporter